MMMTESKDKPRRGRWLLPSLIIVLAIPIVAITGMHYFGVIAMSDYLIEKVWAGIVLLAFLALASFVASSITRK